MLRFFAGILIGIYLEQTYKFPNVYNKMLELDKYLKERNNSNNDSDDSNSNN